MISPPQPAPDSPPIPDPRDTPYDGVIALEVDATDVRRGIYRIREWIPVRAAGTFILLYPQWVPGYHSPQAPIELLAGLQVVAEGRQISWRRDPVNVYAFHLDLPEGTRMLEVQFQYLSPTDSKQERVTVTPALLSLQWNTVLLHPAGHFARQIQFQPTLTLPDRWQFASALDVEEQAGDTIRFAPLRMDTLVDSPVVAGRHLQRATLSEGVRLHVVADHPRLLAMQEEQLAAHRALVEQADRLFGARHFDHYDFLLALSEEAGEIGVEHHRSCEVVSLPGYFAEWEKTATRHSSLAHEYVHSWNGKFRRGAESWIPCFNKPIRNSLMWVYEGLTQYYGQVLATRCGFWTKDLFLGSLASTAARHLQCKGRLWRTLGDTTRDPIIVARSPMPWPSWQRQEDYYTEGMLLWLEIDTLIRQGTQGRHCLDDFMRAFFGMEDGAWETLTYRSQDVTAALERLLPYEWESYLEEKIHTRTDRPPLEGLARGGYELVYLPQRSEYTRKEETLGSFADYSHAIGMIVTSKGAVKEVMWESPAYDAGVTAGDQLLAVAGKDFSLSALESAIESGNPELVIRHKSQVETAAIFYQGGHRFPHLRRTAAPAILDQILAPK